MHLALVLKVCFHWQRHTIATDMLKLSPLNIAEDSSRQIQQHCKLLGRLIQNKMMDNIKK